MAREHPNRRAQLEIINGQFPTGAVLRISEVAELLKKSRYTVYRQFDGKIFEGTITKLAVADWMCEHYG